MEPELKGVFATLPRTSRGLPTVLGGDPKGKKFLYTNKQSVIIRDIANPSIAEVVTLHAANTTVAKYSPSGFYIASADVSGKIKIWDTISTDHIQKAEYQPISGTIKDIAWTEDSKRIAVVGEGREKFGHVFAADTGASVGEIMGHSKCINSCDFKMQRPYRLATAGEDCLVGFFEGPPFKLKTTKSDHQRFVNSLRYAPDGSVFISGGADGKAFIYDGKTGELQAELGAPAHKGGIYGLSFSADSKKLLTVSGEKMAKIWDLSTASVVQEYTLGKEVPDQQVGCLWQNEYILTLSLSGCINYLDPNSSAAPYRIIRGHQNPITAMDLSASKESLVTGASSGEVCKWNMASGECDYISGKGHTNQVNGLVLQEDDLVTCGMDDAVVFSSLRAGQFGDKVRMPSQPRAVASADGDLVVVACIKDLVVMRNRKVVFSQHVDFEPSCVTISPGLTEVVVGGDKCVKVYNLSSDTLMEQRSLPIICKVCDVKFSPDGAYLAVCHAERKVLLYTLPDYAVKISTEWTAHTASVTSLSWAPDGIHLGSVGIDTMAVVWEVNSRHYQKVPGLHKQCQINTICWLDNNTFVTSGQDSCVRRIQVQHK